MAKGKQQSFEHHTRWDVLTHFILGPIFLVNVGVRIVLAVRQPGWETIWDVVVGIALFLLNIKVRVYSLKVQDRVIRLEERLRLARLLPEPLRSRIGELTEAQLIALRFASDAEVPPLVEHVISKQMQGKEIKRAIQVWRPDYFRV